MWRQLSWGTFRTEPATNQFDWSFAPMPVFDDRFGRQNRFGPPPEFPPASPYTSIAHWFSGGTLHTSPWLCLAEWPRCARRGGRGPAHARGRLPAPLNPLRSCSLRYVGIRVPSPCRQGALLGPCYKTGPTPDSTPGGSSGTLGPYGLAGCSQAVGPLRAAPCFPPPSLQTPRFLTACSTLPRLGAGAQCRGANGLVCA